MAITSLEGDSSTGMFAYHDTFELERCLNSLVANRKHTVANRGREAVTMFE